MPRRTVDLDLRAFSSSQRGEEVLRAFRELLPGDVIHAVLDGDPHLLLDAFERERPGEFDWSPLEEGPRIWRVRIDRRASSGRRNGVMEYLAWDHDRLDETLHAAREQMRRGDWAAGLLRFADFRNGLLRHIRMEEEILLPTLEERALGWSATHPQAAAREGPTEVMREEHRQMEQMLEGLTKLAERTAVARGRDGSCAGACGGACAEALDSLELEAEGALGALIRLLSDHNTREEEVLYPAVDYLLDGEERDAIVRRMQRISA